MNVDVLQRMILRRYVEEGGLRGKDQVIRLRLEGHCSHQIHSTISSVLNGRSSFDCVLPGLAVSLACLRDCTLSQNHPLCKIVPHTQ